MALLRFTFELFLGGVWVDVTTMVRHQKVTITRGTRDEAPKLTPAKALLRLHNSDDRFNPRNPLGPYYGLLVRNTPLRVRCSGGVPDDYRFYGEVFAFQPRTNENRSNAYVDIEANGALRRIIKNKSTPHSYYRSWINTRTFSPIPVYHWALEEGSDAVAGAPDIGSGFATFANTPPAGAAWGKGTMNDWHPNGVLINNLNTLTFPCDMRDSVAASWQVSGIFNHTANETVTQIEINCVTLVWMVQIFSPGPDYNFTSVQVIKPDGSVINMSFDILPMNDRRPVWFNFRVSFSAGTITAYWTWKSVGHASMTVSVPVVSTHAAAANVYPRYVAVSSVANTPNNTSNVSATGLKDLSVCTAAIGTAGVEDPFRATYGGISEDTDARFARMCDEQGINNTASPFGSGAMGRQYNQSLEEHLEEILASSRHSGIVESRVANEIQLLGLAPNRGTIDLTEIVPELEPAEDDRNTANIVRLANSHAGEAILTKTTGEMSVAEIGPFESKLDTNRRYLSHAVGLAGLVLARGTWPGPRFVEITVSARSNPARYAFYRSIDVGDFVGLTGMQSLGYYDDMLFRVTSLRETISHEDHRFTFTVRPGELEWDLFTIGTSRLDATSTVVTDGGATLTVTPSSRWSTTAVPYDVMAAGERMTVTAATATVLTVTRSVNGVIKTVPTGAEVHIYPGTFIRAV